MERYIGKLDTITAKRIKNNKALLKSLLKNTGLNAPKGKLITMDESIKRYNPGITDEEIKAWIWYRRMQGQNINVDKWKNYIVPLASQHQDKWVKEGVLFIENGNYVPFPIFVFGNIYTKISNLKKEKDYIVENYGNSVYDNHLRILEQNKPRVLSISNPKISERPVILAISKFAKEFRISNLKESTGVILETEETLQDAYKDYLRNLNEDVFKRKTNAFEIINYYLNGDNKPRSIDKIEWKEIQRLSRDYGEKLFKTFLHEALMHEDQVKIDAHWNMNYNAVATLQYAKIPVGVEVSRSFHGFELDIRPAQREALAFMEMVGSGIIAYDVGVGKTIAAILELASAMQNGKAKRPLIVVPNPTYKNWIKEMFGFDDKAGILTGTGIKLNEWYNLGVDIEKNLDLSKKVPENTITLVTFQGMQKIGLKDENNSMFFELSNILDQGDSNNTKREQEKRSEKYREIIGIGQKETIADIEVLGFDYIVIDEAHNFKNIFSEVKSEKDSKKHFHIKGGKPSSRGIKAFFLCNYIQRTYGRNVMLLTATPFTNSPLEIYSMLSLVAHEYMKRWGILNIKDFFEQYILETSENVVGVDGEIKMKNVVKSFNNRISLQKLINSHINFKTGEEANVPRPCKINLPKTTEETEFGIKRLPQNQQITTYLKPTDEQEMIQNSINEEASRGVTKDDPGKLLRLMSQSLNNALSPFIYRNAKPSDYREFVETSPKIMYTMEAIQSVKKWHESRGEEVSGQVIYIDRGKDYFAYIKQYLEIELGYKRSKPLRSNPRQKVDEVEIITGGISTSKKEKIKTAFNEGVCKIIIGTSTIKEGINLQKKSTVLYNLYPNWNPTDIRQLEGRIWRQKNENGFVRIVMPLVENSMDVFVFQKLEEKTSRINDLWKQSDRGNVLDEPALDPNEIKFALLTDIGKLTRFEIKQIEEELRRSVGIYKSNIESLGKYEDLRNNYDRLKEKVRTQFENKLSNVNYVVVFTKDNYTVYLKDLPSIKLKDLNKSEKEKVKRVQKVHDELQSIDIWNATDKEIIQATSKLNRFKNDSYDWVLNQFKDVVSKYQKLKRSLFTARGYDESTDLSVIQSELAKELEVASLELEEVKTEEFYNKIFSQIAEKKAKLSLKGGSLSDKVADFKRLNYLLSYKFRDVDINTCKIPSVENKNRVDKNRMLNLAKAKMKMAKAKLKLIA